MPYNNFNNSDTPFHNIFKKWTFITERTNNKINFLLVCNITSNVNKSLQSNSDEGNVDRFYHFQKGN